jgi:hypothetical protein
MRNLVLTVVCLLGAVLPACAEPTAQRETLVGATVTNVCRFGGVTVSGGRNAAFSATTNGGSITINALADQNTARALPASISVTFEGLCNEPQSIRLISTRGGLKPDQSAAASGTFQSRVDYTASLNWGSDQTSLTTDGTASGSTGLTFNGAQSGAVTLSIDIPAGSQPLVAGNYSDVLTVEFVNGL